MANSSEDDLLARVRVQVENGFPIPHDDAAELLTAYATVQAERDARADALKEWDDRVGALQAELATLRETLVGEVEKAVKAVPVRYDEAPEAWVRLHDIDRALAQLLRGAP